VALGNDQKGIFTHTPRRQPSATERPTPAVRGTEIEWTRLPEANLPVLIPYRDIVELQATTAGMGPDTPEAAFQRLAAVNSSVRMPGREVERDLPLPKTAANAILILKHLEYGNVGLNPVNFRQAKPLNTIRGPGPNRMRTRPIRGGNPCIADSRASEILFVFVALPSF
jgi:hypothetical protein